jgi:hypothetical protein
MDSNGKIGINNVIQEKIVLILEEIALHANTETILIKC